MFWSRDDNLQRDALCTFAYRDQMAGGDHANWWDSVDHWLGLAWVAGLHQTGLNVEVSDADMLICPG